MAMEQAADEQNRGIYRAQPEFHALGAAAKDLG